MFLFDWRRSDNIIKCEFKTFFNIYDEDGLYTCCIDGKELKKNIYYTYDGVHFPGNSNTDIDYIQFKNCILDRIPQNLKDFFPNFKYLEILRSNLTELYSYDLDDYKQLKGFRCKTNELKFLPGNLFEGFHNLKIIHLEVGRFEFVEPNILDGLNNLKKVTIYDGKNYQILHQNQLQEVKKLLSDVIFKKYHNFAELLYESNMKDEEIERQKTIINDQSSLQAKLNDSLRQVEKKIPDLMHQLKVYELSKNPQNQQIQQLKSVNGRLKKDNGQLKQSNNSLQSQVQKLKNSEDNLKKSIENLKTSKGKVDLEVLVLRQSEINLYEQINQLEESERRFMNESQQLRASNLECEEFQKKFMNLEADLSNQVKQLQINNKNLRKENSELKKLKSDQKNQENLDKKATEPSTGLMQDISTYIQDDSKKDMNIVIDVQKFLVHKFVLAARSPTLAEILKNNPEVENLNLVDISIEIFEKILKFLYTDELPGDDDTNFLELFAAAGKLKIQKLAEHAATKITDQVNSDNAIEIFRHSVSFGLNDLKQKAFQEVKKKFKNIKFKDELINDPEKVIKIIAMYKKKEEALKKFNEEYKELM